MALDALLTRLEKAGASVHAGVPANIRADPVKGKDATPVIAQTAGYASLERVAEKSEEIGAYQEVLVANLQLNQTLTVPGQIVQKAARHANGCFTCLNCLKPGRVSRGYCGGGRDDLERAYGANHPLRKLPENFGAECAFYESINGL